MTLGAILMVKEPGAKGFRVELPDNERGRSPEDLKRLDILNARLSKPPARRGRMSADDARAADLKERDDLEQRTVVKLDRKWAKDAADETEALADLRGEEVAPRSGTGRVTILSRDPLLSLVRAGSLTAQQYDAAMDMRDLYERRQTGLGSQMGGLGGISSPTYDNAQTTWDGVQRGKAMRKVANIENAILVGCFRMDKGKDDQPELCDVEGWDKLFTGPNAKDRNVALAMLRRVCEHDMTIRSLVSGRPYERHVEAFAAALDVADVILRGR